MEQMKNLMEQMKKLMEQMKKLILKWTEDDQEKHKEK